MRRRNVSEDATYNLLRPPNTSSRNQLRHHVIPICDAALGPRLLQKGDRVIAVHHSLDHIEHCSLFVFLHQFRPRLSFELYTGDPRNQGNSSIKEEFRECLLDPRRSHVDLQIFIFRLSCRSLIIVSFLIIQIPRCSLTTKDFVGNLCYGFECGLISLQQ